MLLGLQWRREEGGAAWSWGLAAAGDTAERGTGRFSPRQRWFRQEARSPVTPTSSSVIITLGPSLGSVTTPGTLAHAGCGQTRSLTATQGTVLYVARRCFSQALGGFLSRGDAAGGSGRSGLRVALGWRAGFCRALCRMRIPFSSPKVLAWAESRRATGRLWSLLLWRYSSPAWTRSCAACSG